MPEGLVAASVVTTLTLVYSAPTPGAGSRYLDGRVPHEARVLSAIPVRDALAVAGGFSAALVSSGMINADAYLTLSVR